MLKQKLLNPILQAIFPVLTAVPPPGEEDPEDEEDDSGDGTDNDNPKHCAAQVGKSRSIILMFSVFLCCVLLHVRFNLLNCVFPDY